MADFSRWFEEDPVLYSEVKDILECHREQVIFYEKEGFLIFDTLTKTYHGSAQTKTTAQKIINQLPTNYGCFVVMNSIFKEVMKVGETYHSVIVSNNYVYQSRERLKIAETSDIRVLDKGFLTEIKENYSYKLLCTDAYVTGALMRGMLGLFVRNQLIGFIGVHENGAMGMLEIYPGHTGQGYGTLLTASYVNYLLEQDYQRAVCAHIKQGNIASERLHLTLGFSQSSRPCLRYFS